MSKPRVLISLAVKLGLISILLVFCTSWPGYDDFGSVENLSVATIVLLTGAAFTLETIAILAVDRQKKPRTIWLVASHLFTVLLAILQSVCVLLYSQTASNNYHHLKVSLQWTSVSDPSLIATAEILMKSISIVIALLSLTPALMLHSNKRASIKADLDEICTSPYVETDPNREPDTDTTGLYGSPYL